MNTDELTADLGLCQISDSFFPSGLYATSNGLESLFVNKKITSREELTQFISMQILQAVGPCDCVILSNTIKFAKKHDAESIYKLDKMMYALKSIKEIRDASCRSGTQLLKTINKFETNDLLIEFMEHKDTVCMHPVAFGVVANALNIDVEKALLSFLYGFVVSVVGAALRLGIIQHFEGQQIIHKLKDVIIKSINENKDKEIHEIWQFQPHTEIYQMYHEQMNSKMFIT